MYCHVIVVYSHLIVVPSHATGTDLIVVKTADVIRCLPGDGGAGFASIVDRGVAGGARHCSWPYVQDNSNKT